jgi:hypothetical protein
MRTIRISVPSGKVKMVMWEGTEDEEEFEIKSLKRGTPYIKAYGVKYELTKEEINYIKSILSIMRKK